MYGKSLLIYSAMLLLFSCADNNNSPVNNVDSTTVTEKPVTNVKKNNTGDEEEPEGELIPYDPTIPEEGQRCYIRKFFTVKDSGFIEADYIQFLTGDDAQEAAQKRKDGVWEVDENGDTAYAALDDYYIINDNPTIRTLKLAPGAEFWAFYMQGDIYRKKLPFKYLNPKSKDEFAIYILLFNDKGEVTRINGQYMP